jgi:single-strand DNA-binding protein
MGYVNEALVVGRLGAAPELDYTKNGMAVCRMSVATHQKYKKGEQTITETEWHKAVVFGRRAEIAAEALKKGSEVFVKGVKRTSVYKNKSGQQKQKVELIALDIKWPGSEKFDFTAPQTGGKLEEKIHQQLQPPSSRAGSTAIPKGASSSSPKPIAQFAMEATLSEDQIENELAELRKQNNSIPAP